MIVILNMLIHIYVTILLNEYEYVYICIHLLCYKLFQKYFVFITSLQNCFVLSHWKLENPEYKKRHINKTLVYEDIPSCILFNHSVCIKNELGLSSSFYDRCPLIPVLYVFKKWNWNGGPFLISVCDWSRSSFIIRELHESTSKKRISFSYNLETLFKILMKHSQINVLLV